MATEFDDNDDETSTRKAGPKASPFDSKLAGSVRDSAQQIWLAGMGAFAKAQAEGKQVFDTLVKEGSSLQKKTQGAAGEKLDEVSGRMSSLAEGMSARAGQQWGKFETLFEDGTARAMKRLGVPTGKDIQALGDRIEALSAQVAANARAAARAAAVRKTGAARKTAAKRTSRSASKTSAAKPSDG